MGLQDFKIKVIDTVFDPNFYGFDVEPRLLEGRKLTVMYDKNSKNKALYKVWIFLSGEDLDLVESVTYTLHKSFNNPIKKINRSLSNLECSLIIWTWGVFQVNVIVKDKFGGFYEFSHNLNYSNLLSKYYDQIEFATENIDSIPRKVA